MAIFISTFFYDLLVRKGLYDLIYAIIAGAHTGGGLTIIAKYPNPIGQCILKRFFDSGISSGQLLKYALIPILILALIFNLNKIVKQNEAKI